MESGNRLVTMRVKAHWRLLGVESAPAMAWLSRLSHEEPARPSLLCLYLRNHV